MLMLLLAQQDPGGGGAPPGQALPTPLELFLISPWINGTLLGLSVLAVALFLFFLLTINSRALAPTDLIDEIKKLVDRHKFEAAGDLCRAHRRVFVASIIQRCVENVGRGHGVIMDMLDTEGRRRADVLWNRVSYLADISNVAPMLGLLGTVLGMIKAFFALEEQQFSFASGGLARGVGEAMSTTMFGLLVGILALVFYSIIKARATRALADAEQAVHGVADRIRREPANRGRTREADDLEQL
jgi:biopolymer transport protein ExbB